jgi:hypothetical protein
MARLKWNFMNLDLIIVYNWDLKVSVYGVKVKDSLG